MKNIKTTDLRGEKFIAAQKGFIKVIIKYFSLQVNDYIKELEDNPQLFVGIVKKYKKESTREKYIMQKLEKKARKMQKIEEKEFEDISEEMIVLYVAAFMAGQELQEFLIQRDIQIGISFDINNVRATEWASENAGKMIRGIDETTQKQVAKLIVKSIDNGKTIGETATAIEAKFKSYNQYRASLIAQMEIATAFAEGSSIQFAKYEEEFNQKGYKKNYDQGDSAVREEHGANTDEGWIASDKEFEATGTQKEPHGLNCRCYVQYSLIKPE